MSDYRHKRHNVSVLIYHIVCPAKDRRVVFSPEVDTVLKEICLDIAKRYAIAFLEIGTDNDHVHFLVRSCTPTLRIMFWNLSRPVYVVPISRFSALETCVQPLVHASSPLSERTSAA